MKLTKRMIIVNNLDLHHDPNVVHEISMEDLERIYKEQVRKFPGRNVSVDVCFDYDDKNDHDGMITIKEE